MSRPNRDMKIVLDALAQLQGRHSDVALQTALTETAREAREKAVRRITKQVALSPNYVKGKLRVFSAAQKSGAWEAGVQATRRGVLLTRYQNQRMWVPKKRGGGKKHGGVSGRINPTGRYSQPKFFYVPNLRGSGATGIAVRTGKGRNAFDVLHGPSVSQVFQTVRTDLSAELEDTAARRVAVAIDNLLDN